MISSGRSPQEHAEARLRRIFPDDPGFSGATDWAREVLSDAGLNARRSPLRSLRALRRAERRLDLVSARYLVESIAGRRRSGRRSGIPPLAN